MAVKLVLLKSGEKLITDVKEGLIEEKVVCYILEKPCTVHVNGSYKIIDDEEDSPNRVSISLQSWPSLSKQTVIEITLDWVLTIAEPNEELKELYETQVLGEDKDGNNQNISIDE